MSRSAVAVLALIFGFALVACLAASLAAGTVSFFTSVLTFTVVMSFVVVAVFEIKRLSEL
jgi:hypothetical protein